MMQIPPTSEALQIMAINDEAFDHNIKHALATAWKSMDRFMRRYMNLSARSLFVGDSVSTVRARFVSLPTPEFEDRVVYDPITIPASEVKKEFELERSYAFIGFSMICGAFNGDNITEEDLDDSLADLSEFLEEEEDNESNPDSH